MAENELYKTALSKAMALCSKREYCRAEIESKLEQWSIDSGSSLKIINALVKENFINETRYAEAFVKDKFRYNKWGRIKISAMLKAKKIPYETIKSAMDSIDEEDYYKTIKDLLSNHRRTIKAKNQYDLKAKLLRYGLSKGFESVLIYDFIDGD